MTLKNQYLPYWSQVGEGIIYRGTLLELNEEMLTITLTNKGLQDQLIAKRTLPLKGTLDSQMEAQVQIHRVKGDTSESSFQSATIKGSIKVASMPRYLQTGESF